MGIDVRDGSVRWRLGDALSVHHAIVDPSHKVIYVTSLFGAVEAIRAPSAQPSAQSGAQADASPASIWQIKLDEGAFPTLLPLGGGGVMVHTRTKLHGVSSGGVLLWEIEAPMWISDWALVDDQLVLSTLSGGGSLWTVDQEGLAAWPTHTGGQLVVAGDHLYAYDSDGIHHLDPKRRAAEQQYALPNGLLGYGDMVVLPGGDAIVVHRDRARTSLVALTADNQVRWQRSLASIAGQKRLLALDGDAYLVAEHRTSSFTGIAIYGIDLESGTLWRAFDGGSRSSATRGTWVVAGGDERLLINLQGTGLIALDATSVQEAVAEAVD
jgi:hypothetical protein